MRRELRTLVPGALATILASSAAADTGDTFVLSSSGWEVGKTTTVSTVGPPGSQYWLMFDVSPGHYQLPSGDYLELGLSWAFFGLDSGVLGNTGRRDWTIDVPGDPGLVGYAFYLQSLGIPPGTALLRSSNAVHETIGGGGGGTVEKVYPLEWSSITDDGSVEVWVLGSVDFDTVNSSTVTMRDTVFPRDIPLSLKVRYDGDRTVIVATPTVKLRHQTKVALTLSDAVLTYEGTPLSGQKEFHWNVADREHPFLFNTPSELAINETRADAGLYPWKPAADYQSEDAVKGLKHTAHARKGGPPTGWNDFYAMYVDWFDDMKYAQATAMEWHLHGDPKYGDKAVELLTAWLVFDPKKVGEWYWSIQYDIAGLSMLDTADLIWNYGGLGNGQRDDLRRFFDDLGGVIKAYQLDNKDKNPGNIRSWNNTMMVGIGHFNGDADLVKFTMDTANPFHHQWMLDNAMEDSGRMYDWVREKEAPPKGITYPVYHLQAWALFGEFNLHSGLDTFHWKNVRGHDMTRAWEYYIPYLQGDKKVDGYTEDLRRVDISKSYVMQKMFRRSDVDHLYDLYGGEPYFEVHIFKKASSFSHPIPGSLLGKDDEDPKAPKNPWTPNLGATFVTLAWDACSAVDEGDLPCAYMVYRDGERVGSTAALRFCDTGLSPQTAYDYEIRAMDYAGNEGPPVPFRTWTRTIGQ